MKPGLFAGGGRETPWIALLALGVAATPLSSRVAGVLWLALCLSGAFYAWRRRAHPPAADAALTSALSSAIRLWVWAATASLLLGVLGAAIWRSGWDELHAPARLAIAAWASLALSGLLARPLGRRHLVASGLGLAGFAALGLALTVSGDRQFPTNAIAWAVSVGFLMCLLLPQVFEAGLPVGLRLFRAAGLLAGVLGVLLSQSRGAWGIVPWVLLAGGLMAASGGGASTPRHPRRALAALAIGLVVVGLAFSTSQALRTRITLAQQEWSAASPENGGRAGANTSVGARIYIWRLAAEGFAQSPWIGVGAAERKQRIETLGKAVDSPIIQGLGHVHNELLEAAFDHGLVGVAATLAVMIGLVALGARLWRIDRVAGWQVFGLAFMHITAGLTNVNTAHNYYGAVLASCLLIVLAGARPREDAAQRPAQLAL